MRRIGRWILIALVAPSLLLCMVAVILWARSYWFSDQFLWARTGRYWSIQTASGRIVLGLDWEDGFNRPIFTPPLRYPFRYAREPAATPDQTGMVGRMYELDIDPADRYIAWTRGGFRYYLWEPPGNHLAITTTVAPFWSITLLIAATPLCWTAGRWRRRVRERWRRRSGLCPSCGYDLRATRDRCPECGRAPDKPAGILS